MKSSLSGLLRLGIVVAALSIPVFAGAAVPPSTVPEPATLALIGTGIATVAGIRYLRNRKR